jgi:hypothetical protein
MGAAQIAAAQTVIRSTARPVTPTRPNQRRGNNPAAPKPPPPPKVASGTTTGISAELARVKAELVELKKTTNQQLLTEVKFLRGRKNELEVKVQTLETQVADLRKVTVAQSQVAADKTTV